MNPSAVADDVSALTDQRVFELAPRRQAVEADALRMVVQAAGDDAADRAAFRAGLLAPAAVSSPKFFYDPQGSALFTAICELDEYYPTRTEAAIFEGHRGDIAAALPVGSQWVDLGCGDGVKARGWLDPAQVRRYVGVDIAEPWLRSSLEALIASLAKDRAVAVRRGPFVRSRPIEVLGIVADFTRPFDLHDILAERPDMPPVFFYPGSSIGNFAPDDAQRFLADIHLHCLRAAGSGLLIGVDTRKDPARLRSAYDDAPGVTAAFNRNALRHVNRVVGADFDPAAFDHVAFFDERRGRVEMHLVARQRQVVHIGGHERAFAEGETIHTENSYKYAPAEFTTLLQSAGFARVRCWQDDAGDFAVYYAA